MKKTKRQRENQEREYAEEMNAIFSQQKIETAEQDADIREEQSRIIRTQNNVFQDSYCDPIIHIADYE